MKIKHYWRELQRRHVVKAGLAYLVVAWLLIQVLDILLDAFQLGAGWMQTAIITLSVGFPIWLILAWIYDFSWGSIQKTEDVPFDAEVSRKKNVGLNRVIIGGLSIAVILLVVNTLRLSNKVDEIEGQFLSMEFTNSLAILPFEDLSPKQDQRYFSDGLARSIYNRMARFKDLKLISPTSSFQYRDKDISIEVIAEELGVRYVLEGSVQLFDSRYRASITLVDSQDGTTIWSKTFDDSLEDVLDTYDEVAQNVGQFLKVTISSKDVRNRKVDPEAYLLYLRADDTIRGYNKEVVYAADSLIRVSLKIDPTYSLSHATLSMTTLHKGLYHFGYSFDDAVNIGLKAAKKAIELDPDHFYGYNWLSNWQWHARDVQASNAALAKAWNVAPNGAGVNHYSAFNARRQNRLRDCLKYSERAVLLDPKNTDPYQEIAWANMMLGDLSRAETALHNYYEPDYHSDNRNKDFGVLYLLKGETKKALVFTARSPDKLYRLTNQSILYHSMGETVKSDSTLSALKKLPNDEFLESDVFYSLAMVHAYRKENDLAFEFLDKAKDYIKIYLEWFFVTPEFKNLYDDPRWDAYIDRLSEEFNYDFPHRPE